MRSCFRRLLNIMKSDLGPYFVVVGISLFAAGLIIGKEL